jgi:uncharacterized protein (TIGR02246 family)
MSRDARFAIATRLAPSVALAAFVALGLASCTPGTQNQKAAGTDDRTVVRAFFENYVDALNSSDTTQVLSSYAPDADVTVAGRGVFFHGREAIAKTSESLLNPGQNTYQLDSLDVRPIERSHILALVVYTVEPSDLDIPAFHSTASYILRRSNAKWQIIHAHVSSAREL